MLQNPLLWVLGVIRTKHNGLSSHHLSPGVVGEIRKMLGHEVIQGGSKRSEGYLDGKYGNVVLIEIREEF